MRTKTETRRQAILATAAKAFCERGFDATSMSEVASRLGGSKATLYNYFCSKEQLFAAVMVEQVRDQKAHLIEAFEHAEDLASAIRQLAPDYLKLVLRADVLAIQRMCVAEGERCGFAQAVYEEGPKPAWERIAARLGQAMEAGGLRRADPWRAAMHLKGLLDAELVEPRLLGWRGPPTEDEIECAARDAAEAFLRAYAP